MQKFPRLNSLKAADKKQICLCVVNSNFLARVKISFLPKNFNRKWEQTLALFSFSYLKITPRGKFSLWFLARSQNFSQLSLRLPAHPLRVICCSSNTICGVALLFLRRQAKCARNENDRRRAEMIFVLIIRLCAHTHNWESLKLKGRASYILFACAARRPQKWSEQRTNVKFCYFVCHFSAMSKCRNYSVTPNFLSRQTWK